MKPAPATRHLVSINDLSDDEIERVFKMAQDYLHELPDPHFPWRIGRSTHLAADFILGTLFYEPSTRTRLSFESAMARLGGRIVTSADPATSSAAKGESLADTVRVIANYADVIVLRHPRDGAARLAAEYSPVPVINAGDGGHEHPTQTLCDLFTLRQKNKSLKNLNVALSGDLKGSRTIHSFVYALARFGANIMCMPAEGMELPGHVASRLREDFNCVEVAKDKYESQNAAVDALYVTPDKPHQLSFIAGADADRHVDLKADKVDAVYVTRFQKERWADKEQPYPRIDVKFLKERKYAKASIMHALPRVDELDVALDSDERAAYFQQAAYGVPIRMALISLILGVRGDAFERFTGGLRDAAHPLYDQPLSVGIRCHNRNCITHDPLEASHMRNKFHVIARPTGETEISHAGAGAATHDAEGQSAHGSVTLRCIYCETDITQFSAGESTTKTIIGAGAMGLRNDITTVGSGVIFFQDDAAARDAGFTQKKTGGATSGRAAGKL